MELTFSDINLVLIPPSLFRLLIRLIRRVVIDKNCFAIHAFYFEMLLDIAICSVRIAWMNMGHVGRTEIIAGKNLFP